MFAIKRWHITVLCDSPSTPHNGAYTTATDGEVSTSLFTCSNGYTLQGVNEVTCAISGAYSGQEPTCS